MLDPTPCHSLIRSVENEQIILIPRIKIYYTPYASRIPTIAVEKFLSVTLIDLLLSSFHEKTARSNESIYRKSQPISNYDEFSEAK
jgi:hypothetical protein